MRVELKVRALERTAATQRFLTVGWLAVVSLALGCSETQEPSQTPINPGAFIVSSPVQGLDPAVTVRSAATFESTVVWISLPPGAIHNGITASIRNLRTGSSLTVQMVDGGFDPVALPAVEGDPIAINVQAFGVVRPLSFRCTALARTRPSVVRASPSPHKRDVALSSIMVIVFSEPIDSATLDTNSVKLFRGATPVAGSIRFADAPHLRAEFHPDSLLSTGTDYQLIVTTAISDLNGLPLDSAITVPFTTGTGITYSIGGTVSGLAGTGLVLKLYSTVGAWGPPEDLPVAANGPIVFASTLEGGVDYNVTVSTLPSSPAQLCVVAGGYGAVASANVTDISITCFGADPSLTGQILFTVVSPPYPEPFLAYPASDIMLLDLDRSTITRLTSGFEDDRSPQWSPDRSRIAFIRSPEEGPRYPGLWVMRADGSGAVQIPGPPNTWVHSFCWSPDGRRLAVENWNYSDQWSPQWSSFGMVNADGSGAITLADSGGMGCNSWSPDGSTIVFEGALDYTPDWSPVAWLYLMDPDGSNVRRLTSAATYGGPEPLESEPSWSPDGTKLAFFSFMYGITVVGRDGTTAYSVMHEYYDPLTGTGSPPLGWAPDWSPDGTHLVFWMNQQLFVTLADGSGTPRQLTSVPGPTGDPPAWFK
jgi:Tol biopolymer transport system component